METFKQIITAYPVYQEADLVLCYGSAVTSSHPFDKARDIDLAFYSHSAQKMTRRLEHFQGYLLDAWCYPLSAIKEVKCDEIRLRDACVLKDTHSYWPNMQATLMALYEKGPMRDQNHLSFMAKWLTNTLTLDGTDLKSLFKQQQLAEEALIYYFDVKNQWYEGISKSLASLKAHDTQAYACLERWLKKRDITALHAFVTAATVIRET